MDKAQGSFLTNDLREKILKVIEAGETAVEELIKVAQEEIITGHPDEDLAADRLKNAAATKKLAIFDAFEILNRIQEEESLLENKPIEKKEQSFKGFAERRSK